MEKIFEIAIVGTGPAGLSAALNCHSRDKDFVIIGPKEGSKKLKMTKMVENYLGFLPGSGNDLNELFLSTITKLNLEYIDTNVSNVYSLPDSFFIELANGHMIQAKSVILATGVSPSKEIKNESSYLGDGISYCATCDANLYKDKEVVVVGYNHEAIEEARFLNTVVKKVTFVNCLKDPEEIGDIDDIEIINDKPISFEKDSKIKLNLKSSQIEADGFFVIRDSKSISNLVPGIIEDKGHIKVDQNYQTNIKGLYACGDVIGLPYQIAKAVGEGNICGLNACKDIEILKYQKRKA